jgi:hypothetical protein
MQQIEASIGKHHAPPIAVFRPQLDNQFIFADDLPHAKFAPKRNCRTLGF